MAVPVDYQKYWSQGNAGIADAMPHINKAIQDGKPGSPTLQRYIDEFETRVNKGENPQTVTDELAAAFEQDIRNGVQHADVNVPNVGFNQGAPAVGNGNLTQPTAQAPNSFTQQPQSDMGGGSFNGMTPPASAMGGGVTGNAGGMPQPAPAPQWGAPIPTNPAGVMTAPPESNGAPEKVVQVPGAPMDDKPIPYEETPKIDLTKGRMGGGMNTIAPPAPPRKLMNRGEQEQAMADIERVNKLKNSEESLDIKRDKLEAESKLKMLKAMSSRLSDKEKRDLMATLGEKGMTLKAQIAVMNAAIQLKNAEEANKTKQETNRIRASKGSEKLSPKLQHEFNLYKETKARLGQYENSLLQKKNPEELKRLRREKANALQMYNLARIEEGYDIFQDEGYVTPEAPNGVTDPGE